MRKGTPKLSSFKRTIALLEVLVKDAGDQTVSALAREIGVPLATAHRHLMSLVDEGLIAHGPAGRYTAGPRLMGMLHLLDEKQIVSQLAAPEVHALAEQTGLITQLGTLENEMVTYRIKAGHSAGDLFTKVGMQLEAYCSAIGKVLLANLPKAERDSYLSNGPFVPLTRNTIVDPDKLRVELEQVGQQDFALDDEEVSAGLRCLAVPVRKPDGMAIAAISISSYGAAQIKDLRNLLPAMRNSVERIEARAFNVRRIT